MAGAQANQRTGLEAGCERKQRNVARLLDGKRETTLVAGADTSQAARHNLATFCHEALKQADVAVADGVDLLGAELADLLAAKELASPGTAARATGTAGSACGAGRTWGAGCEGAPCGSRASCW